MDYQRAGKDILKLVGGEMNIASVAHCATRLRFVLVKDNLADKSALEKLAEVKGVFKSSGEFQVIIGQGAVNKVYAAMVAGTKINQVDPSGSKKVAMKNLNFVQVFARMLSNIFVPIIPAIVASGLLMGLLGMVKVFGWFDGDSGIFKLLDMFSNAAFVFLPILIAFSAAKEFHCNPYLATVLGGILIHPALQNAWTVGGGVKNSLDLFGLNVGMVGYQGTVLPILIAVWLMGYIERGLRKVVPNVLDIILTPFLTLMTSSFIALLIIGPAGRLLGDGISFGLQALFNTGGAFAGIIFGGFYSTIVITGIHHSFHAIEAGLLANPAIGKNFLLPIWSMANIAQGGAALAVYFKTKDAKIKSIAAPASLSCLLGITEAAIFGVNLRFVRPFIAAAIGGALGGGYVTFSQVAMTAVGVTGIPGIAIVQQASIINYLIGFTIAFCGAFGCTYVLGFKDIEQQGETDKSGKDAHAVKEIPVLAVADGEVIGAPMKGKVIALQEVGDETFASKVLGDGIAIEPEDGLVVSPVNGKVLHVMETKHAIALISHTGIEILIHVGMDTVKLNGEGFVTFVKAGDEVKMGDKLLEADLAVLRKRGKSTVTPMVITNSDTLKTLKFLKSGKVNLTESLLSAS